MTKLNYSQSIIPKLGSICQLACCSNYATKANSLIRSNDRLVDINVVLDVFHLNLLEFTIVYQFYLF